MVWLFFLYLNWLTASFKGNFLLAEIYRWVLVNWLTQNLAFTGTVFQQLVWLKISQLNWGETLSYAQLATQLGKPLAFRAVANACGANPWPLIVPCHRVVASNFDSLTWKNLGGYGLGIALKLKLLKLEIAKVET
jgi:O-6-methylguanine DNA methyltransferase